MAAVLAAASYSRGGFSLCLAGSVRRVMVTGGSTFHLKPRTILLLSRGCKAPSELVGQSKHLPVAYNGTPADIRKVIKLFCTFFNLFQ